MKGFLDGVGGAGDPSGVRPVNAANFAGVSSFDDAGGGRPVSFAIAVLIHRMTVNMPSTEPRVFLRLPNCSATDTMAMPEISYSIDSYCLYNLPKNEECVAIYVLSSICAKPPNAPTMLSIN